MTGVTQFLKKEPFLLPAFTFVIFTIFLYFANPEIIIANIGVKNSYLLISILAFLGGMTTFSGIPYHWILVTMAMGGLNPWILGISTGIGVTLGDSSTYFIGFYGKQLIPENISVWFDRLDGIFKRHPNLIPIISFFYGAFAPFSNDVITIPMGVLRYPFIKVMLPLGLGNTLFNTALALLAAYGHEHTTLFF